MHRGEQKLVEDELQLNREYLASAKEILMSGRDDMDSVDLISELHLPRLRLNSVHYISELINTHLAIVRIDYMDMERLWGITDEITRCLATYEWGGTFAPRYSVLVCSTLADSSQTGEKWDETAFVIDIE